MSTKLDLVRSLYAAREPGDFTSTEWARPTIEFVIAAGGEAIVSVAQQSQKKKNPCAAKSHQLSPDFPALRTLRAVHTEGSWEIRTRVLLCIRARSATTHPRLPARSSAASGLPARARHRTTD